MTARGHLASRGLSLTEGAVCTSHERSGKLPRRGTKAAGRRLPDALIEACLHYIPRYDHLHTSPSTSTARIDSFRTPSATLTAIIDSSFHTPIDPPPMPSSAPVTAVAMAPALAAAAFMRVPRSQCDVVETSEDLGDTHHYKRVKLTDCEQEDCPLSIFYVPPRT